MRLISLPLFPSNYGLNSGILNNFFYIPSFFKGLAVKNVYIF
jgi:hypothetical protein